MYEIKKWQELKSLDTSVSKKIFEKYTPGVYCHYSKFKCPREDCQHYKECYYVNPTNTFRAKINITMSHISSTSRKYEGAWPVIFCRSYKGFDCGDENTTS